MSWVYDKADSKNATPGHFSVDDVYEMFDKSPLKLVDYVEKGLGEKRRWVMGVHLIQLAKKVSILPRSGGIKYERLPEKFVDLGEFDNIEEIVTAGHEMFSK